MRVRRRPGRGGGDCRGIASLERIDTVRAVLVTTAVRDWKQVCLRRPKGQSDDRIRESKETFLRLVCTKGIRFSRTYGDTPRGTQERTMEQEGRQEGR